MRPELQKMMDTILDTKKRYNIFAKLYIFIRYTIIGTIVDIISNIGSFIHRGRYGWAPSDVWNFDMYLSKVIVDGINHLNDEGCGYPLGKENGSDILEDIKFPFECILNDSFYVNSRSYDSPANKDARQMLEIDNKIIYYKYPDEHIKILTKEECMRYEKGMRYFQRYFRDLYD